MSSFDRMTDVEVARLALAICATAETLGHALSTEAAELMAEDLADYPKEHVANALKACRKELRGKLTTREIIDRVHAADGRPGEDEAWGIALLASDESDSVVMTEEIMLALAAARPVLARGDKVGARMAFKSAYARAVETARKEAKPVRWELSLGADQQRRIAAVEEAGRLGRLPATVVREHIARLTCETVTQDGLAIVGLITGKSAMPSEEVRRRLQALRASVKENQEQIAREREKAIMEQARAFESAREEQLAVVEELISKEESHA